MDWIGCSANYKWAETFWGIGFWGFGVETCTDDGVQASWQGPFLFRNNTSLDFEVCIWVFWGPTTMKKTSNVITNTSSVHKTHPK